jgi:hypothetical protein
MAVKQVSIFGMSFLDLTSCALGGVLILMFVFASQIQAFGTVKKDVQTNNNKHLLNGTPIFTLIISHKENNITIEPSTNSTMLDSYYHYSKSQQARTYILRGVQGEKKYNFTIKRNPGITASVNCSIRFFSDSQLIESNNQDCEFREIEIFERSNTYMYKSN